jgi:hypothetical protein
MRKSFGLVNVMFWGLLIFILLSLSNIHAATLDWSLAETRFLYDARIACMVEPPFAETIANSTYYDLGVGGETPPPVSSIAEVEVIPLTGVALRAKAFGSIIENGASSSALVSFDFDNDIDGIDVGFHCGDDGVGDTYGGDANSWVKRQGITVDEPGLFDLHGMFQGSENFDNTNANGVYANATFEGGVRLEERIEVAGSSSSLGQTWSLSIAEIVSGTIMQVGLDNEDDEGNAIHYDLLVGFHGNGLQADLSNYYEYGIIDAANNYELGNLTTPLSLDGCITSHVPLPGTLMLLFSGMAGLFGFKLSLLRRGSSNN